MLLRPRTHLGGPPGARVLARGPCKVMSYGICLSHLEKVSYNFDLSWSKVFCLVLIVRKRGAWIVRLSNGKEKRWIMWISMQFQWQFMSLHKVHKNEEVGTKSLNEIQVFHLIVKLLNIHIFTLKKDIGVSTSESECGFLKENLVKKEMAFVVSDGFVTLWKVERSHWWNKRRNIFLTNFDWSNF